MHNKRNTPFRPGLERLESRDTPSATSVTTNLTNGVLTVLGTNYADRITVSQTSAGIRVRGSTATTGQSIDRTIVASAVGHIVIAAETGDDTVVVGNEITKPANIFGSWGNDVLYGGSGADQIFGGDGQDSLYGRGGNDTLYGGVGSDYLDGGLGTNSMTQETVTRAYSANSIELQVVKLVNIQRTSRGLVPLTVNALLGKAAKMHATNMATRSNSIGSAAMRHTLYGTTLPTPITRLDFVGYTNVKTYGENIAFGCTTAQQVVTAWMNSTEHRANILNADFREIGVGMATNASGQIYWSQDFGTRFS